MIWLTEELTVMKFGNLSCYKILNNQGFKFSFAPYFKCFGISPFELTIVYLHCFSGNFYIRTAYILSLAESICKQKILVKDFSDSISRNHANVEINKLV